MEFDPSTGLDDELSDYVGRIDLTPADWLDLRYRFRLDQNDLTSSRNEVGVAARPAARALRCQLSVLEDDPALQSLREREEITAGVVARA